MKAARFSFGCEHFATKKAAAERIRAILYSYPLGASLGAYDAVFVLDVLALHPEQAAKFGCGIASVQVEDNGATRGFWLTRSDGTRTDFSFLSCLSPPSHGMQVLRAMRSEVRPQIEAFRARFPPFLVCPETRETHASADMHVDHVAPRTFDALAAGFLREYGLDLAAVAVLPTRDEETVTRLADPVLAAAWSACHAERARLRMVSRRANLSLLRRGRRTP